MTLIELMVSVLIGIVVTLATLNLVDASGRASAEVEDRVDATQRGRVAMEQITQRLRSQVCLDTNTPAVVSATRSATGVEQLDFFTEFGDEQFTPEARRLTYDSGTITERVWTTLAADPAKTFLSAPTYTRTMLANMAPSRKAPDELVPVFRYFTFLGNPGTPVQEVTPPPNGSVGDVDRPRVVRIVVSFDSRPTRRGSQPLNQGASDSFVNRFNSTFENDVYVRTADPNDPTHSPQCL